MKKKHLIILIAVVAIVIIVASIIIYLANNTEEKAYIDIWKDTSLDSDIDLFSVGTGENEKKYLGRQPIHYHVYETGEMYSYQEGEFMKVTTEEIDSPTINHLKNLSEEELQTLISELKAVVKSNKSEEVNFNLQYWFIRIGNKTTRVDVNVKKVILEKYL